MIRSNSHPNENLKEDPCEMNPSPADPTYHEKDIAEDNPGTTIEPDSPATQSGSCADRTAGKDAGV